MDPHIKAMQELVERETADTIAEWEQFAVQAKSDDSRATYLRIADRIRSTPFPWAEEQKAA